MEPVRIQAKAPGSLMLLGEHAVLHGRHALVAAASRGITVSLRPAAGRSVEVSSALGRYRSDLDALRPDPALRFVLAALRYFRGPLPGGVRLDIESECSSRTGLGTSAAVTAATAAALAAWCGADTSPDALFALTRRLVLEVQGCGSGADAAAAVYGGCLLYRAGPRQRCERLQGLPPVVLAYSGSKTPTPEVIAAVERRRAQQPELFDGLYDLVDAGVRQAASQVNAGDWPGLGRVCDFSQGLMDSMGVQTPALADLIFELRRLPGVFGAKISGSGMGDCAMGIGRAEAGERPRRAVDVALGDEGVRVG